MSGPGQFRFDPGRCLGCETCVLACRTAHPGAQSQPWRRIHTFNRPGLPDLPVFHLSLACHHCRQPACVDQCPAGAYRRDPATGAVVLQPERCLGCRYCTWVCPHGAPRFDPVRGTAEKCGFCLDRQEQGLEPACVARCPVRALGFEARDESPRSGLPPGFPATRTGPSIRFVPGLRPPPVLTAPPDPGLLARRRRALLTVPEPRLSARREWALVAFTTTLAALVALVAAAAAGTGRVLPEPLPYPWLLLWAGAVCLSLSAWHLGHPERGWRALGNLRRSWLSREVALVLAFLGLTALRLPFPRFPGLAWAAATAGFAALFAADRVYQVALRSGRLDFHSAHVLFNGLYLTGLLAGYWPLALAAGALKAWLYLNRKARSRGRGRRPWLSLLRIALGFALPVLAFGGGAAALGAVLGDLVDRWEYYGELSFPSPERQLARDLGSFA